MKLLVEEIAKKTDLPENKIHDVIAKVNKANKLAIATAKGEMQLPVEEPTRQSERLKEHVPVEKEKRTRVKRKETYFKVHKLTAEERKARRDARRAANLAIDLEQGFAKGHTTKDVEDLGLADFFENAGKKPSTQVTDKKKRAMEKLLAFTSKVGGEITIPARKGKETTLLKVSVKKVKVPKVERKRESASSIAGIMHAAKIASMISDHHEKKRAKAKLKIATAVQKLFKNKKPPVNNEVEFEVESEPRVKKMKNWSQATLDKRQAKKDEKHRQRLAKIDARVAKQEAHEAKKHKKWTDREVKRLEKLREAKASGKKVKRKRRNYKKYVVGALSAVYHRPSRTPGKAGIGRSFEDRGKSDVRGGTRFVPSGIAQAKLNKALGKSITKGRGKGRGKSIGGVSKPKGRGKGRSKSLGGAPQGKNYGGKADIFTDLSKEDNPFAGVSFG